MMRRRSTGTGNYHQKSQLERKLGAYALAGAALAAPGVAKASMINVTVNQSFNQSPGPSVYTLDFTTASVTIQALAGAVFAIPIPDPTNEVDVTTANAQVMGSAPFGPSALAFGALIDPNSVSGWESGGKMAGFDIVSLSTLGSWSAVGGDNYLGLYFQGAGGLADRHAGWAHISTSADAGGASFTVLEYAYETAANTPVTAGDTVGVPEPSTMALIALGGAGLIALRRRRAANA